MNKIVRLIILLIPFLGFSQHNIKGTFSPAADYEWVLIYRVTPTQNDYVADAKLDNNGSFEITLDASQPAGMYRVVYAMPQDEYNFDFIYNAKESIEFTFSKQAGLDYLTSTENRMMTHYTITMSNISQSIGNFYREGSTDKEAFLNLFQTLDNTQKEFEKLSQGTLAYNFILANRPYIATTYQDVSTYIDNVKAQYFNNVDFKNKTLQSSNFLVDRVLNYVFGMTAGDGTATQIYKSNIDNVASAMKTAPKNIQAMILGIVWQQLADAKYEEIANYVTDNYLYQLAKDQNDQGILDMIIPFRNISVGKTAPDFEMEIAGSEGNSKVRLSEYDAANKYVLVFWSSVCAHCLEELPQLHDYLSNFQEGELEVIAYGLEDDENSWKNQIFNFPEFQHVCGLGKWENEIGNVYNVMSTPSYFVLDKNKQILAKPENIQELKRILAN